MNSLTIIVHNDKDGSEVLNAILKEQLFDFFCIENTITVEHRLNVRLHRLYIALTGKTPHYVDFPLILVYDNGECDHYLP